MPLIGVKRGYTHKSSQTRCGQWVEHIHSHLSQSERIIVTDSSQRTYNASTQSCLPGCSGALLYEGQKGLLYSLKRSGEMSIQRFIIASASVKNPCHVRLFYASRAEKNPRQNG